MADSPAEKTVGNSAGAERSTWYYVLVVVAIALLTENANFEFTLVSPGLPNIAAEFDTARVGLVMTVVFVASLVFLPIAGKLADLYGKKKILVAASVLFGIGSLLCAVSPVYWLFLVGRVFQSAFVIAYVTGYGLIRDIFPARLVPLGVGALGVGTGASAFIGPVLGGYLIDNHGFRSAFWFVLCYDVVVAALVLSVVPETRVRIRGRIDALGALLLGVAMAVVVFGVVETSTMPVTFPVAALLLVLFVLVERRRTEPMVSLGLLAQPKVWLTLLAAGLAIFVVTASTSQLLPQLLRTPQIPGVAEHGLGLSALDYGISFGLSFGLVGAAAGFAAGWVCRRFAPRSALLTSLVASVVGMLLVLAGQTGSYAMVAIIGALMGIGLGFLYAGANNLIIEAVPAGMQGVSTSLLYTALGVMNSVCTAVVGSITASYTVDVSGIDQGIISDTGFRIASLVLLCVGVAGIAVTVMMRHGRDPASGGAVPDRQAASGVPVAQQPTA